jgi:hypothetical protein
MTYWTTNFGSVLSSERAPQDEERSYCPAQEKKNLVMGPEVMPDTKTDKPTELRQ